MGTPAMNTRRPQSVQFDWRSHTVLAAAQPCRLCGRPALMTDENGVPCHKVCAEADAAQPGRRWGP